LDPAWVSVLEDYADCYLVGLDLSAPAHYQAGYVTQIVGYYDGLLGQLDPVASLIGRINAERITPLAPIETRAVTGPGSAGPTCAALSYPAD
jgi:hypothetical protein